MPYFFKNFSNIYYIKSAVLYPFLFSDSFREHKYQELMSASIILYFLTKLAHIYEVMIEKLFLAYLYKTYCFGSAYFQVNPLVSAIKFHSTSDDLFEFLWDSWPFTHSINDTTENIKSFILMMRSDLLHVVSSCEADKSVLVNFENWI